ncbi:MAG: hypothetical protein WAV41_04465 [Microgenomates group bacterium]
MLSSTPDMYTPEAEKLYDLYFDVAAQKWIAHPKPKYSPHNRITPPIVNYHGKELRIILGDPKGPIIQEIKTR